MGLSLKIYHNIVHGLIDPKIIEGCAPAYDSAIIARALSRTYSLSQNMQARVENTLLPVDGKDASCNIWDSWLDSRTFILYGGKNETGRFRFKVDNEFDLSYMLRDYNLSYDAGIHPKDMKIFFKDSFPLTQEQYQESGGTEFVILTAEDIGDPGKYAIRADKYAAFSQGMHDRQTDMDFGAFKINQPLARSDILYLPDTGISMSGPQIGDTKCHEGWMELAVGMNSAPKSRYDLANRLISAYLGRVEQVSKEMEHRDHPERPTRPYLRDAQNKMMGFYVETGVYGYRARTASLASRADNSDMILRHMNPCYKGHFLFDSSI